MWLILLIQLVNAYQYDEIVVEEVIPYGQVLLQWFLKSYDMDSAHRSSWWKCERFIFSGQECDLIMFTRTAILKPGMPDLRRKYTEYKRLFVIDKHTGSVILSHRYDSTFNVGDVKRYVCPVNTVAYTFAGHGQLIDNSVVTTGEMYFMYLSVVEDDYTYDGGRFNYYEYINVFFIGYIKIGEFQLYHLYPYIIPLTSYTHVQVESVINCHNNYYGINCFFHCNDSVRHFCNCPQGRPNQDICHLTCKPGWIARTKVLTLLIFNMNISSIACDVNDSCYLKPCRLGEYCFVASNTSWFCEEINIDFLQNGKNVTRNTFMSNYLVLVKISKFNIPNFRKLVSLRFSHYGETMYYPFEVEALINSFIFYFSNISFIDSLFTIELEVNAVPWKRYFYRQKEFKVLTLPTNGILTNNFGNKTNLKYVYLGETMQCLSNGKPSYRMFFFYISSIKLKDISQYKQKILVDTKLGIHTIKCNFSLISADLGTMSYVLVKKIYVKKFVYFKWDSFQNVFFEGDIMECISKEHVKAIKKIVQIDGFSSINVANNPVKLNNLEGDTYKLSCSWSVAKSYIYSRNIEFMFQKMAKLPCALFYVPTYGSLAQCGHDGYPQDYYKITASIMIEQNGIVDTLLSKDNYIRIPYKFKYSKFYIHCKIEDKVHGSFIPLWYKRYHTIHTNITFSVMMSNDTQVCEKYFDTIEPLDIHIEGENQIIDTLLFVFNLNALTIDQNLLTFVGILLFIYISALSISLLIYIHSDDLIYAAKKSQALCIKRRHLNEKIEKNVRSKFNEFASKFKYKLDESDVSTFDAY